MIFFKSKAQKARENAKEWHRLAKKVLDYRRDVLSDADVAELEAAVAALGALGRDKAATVAQLEAAGEPYDKLLRRTGGNLYPKGFWAENAEMILVGGIIAIGIRSFFLQPFKIPTNSMYPTYNGMTAKVYAEAERPVAPVRLVRWVLMGARHTNLVAPASGELGFSTRREVVPGRKWLVLPTQKVRYTFYAGDAPMTVDLPLDFDMRQVLGDFFAEGGPTGTWIGPEGDRVLLNGRRVEAGDSALAFDLVTGDQLFVDRMTYHFRAPKVGEPIVFKTDNLEHIDRDNRGKYYIKRAAAGPGDTLEIEPPGLVLNGEPLLEPDAFALNAAQEGEYHGYTRVGPNALYPRPIASGEAPIEVPEGHYFALGDNSANSADGRMWGFVPDREIVGRAVFIYYPLSSDWGVSR